MHPPERRTSCDVEQGSGRGHSGPPSAFINKVLLGQSYADFSTLSLAAFVLFHAQLSSCHRPNGPQSLKHLLSRPLQKAFANF